MSALIITKVTLLPAKLTHVQVQSKGSNIMLAHKTLSQIGQSSTISQYPTFNVKSLSLFVPLTTCYHAEFQNIKHEKLECWLVLRLVLDFIRIF